MGLITWCLTKWQVSKPAPGALNRYVFLKYCMSLLCWLLKCNSSRCSVMVDCVLLHGRQRWYLRLRFQGALSTGHSMRTEKPLKKDKKGVTVCFWFQNPLLHSVPEDIYSLPLLVFLANSEDCPKSVCHFCGRVGHLARACQFGQTLQIGGIDFSIAVPGDEPFVFCSALSPSFVVFDNDLLTESRVSLLLFGQQQHCYFCS